MARPDEILSFWLDEVGPQGWYEQNDDLDRTIISRFSTALEDTMAGRHGFWLTYASGALAYVILTDQFSRNMFRGKGQSFASDRWSRAAAKSAIHHGWDMRISEPARQFFYMPLMHSENLQDQDRAVRLICERMPQTPSTLLHARAHRDIIRRFGRFPFRNDALGRKTSAAESAFIAAGGYGDTVRGLQKQAA